jgi:hypothetical protein
MRRNFEIDKTHEDFLRSYVSAIVFFSMQRFETADELSNNELRPSFIFNEKSKNINKLLFLTESLERMLSRRREIWVKMSVK